MSNTTQHTPGPWRIARQRTQEDDGRVCIDIVGNGINVTEVYLAEVHSEFSEQGILEANAALIAAAPETAAERDRLKAELEEVKLASAFNAGLLDKLTAEKKLNAELVEALKGLLGGSDYQEARFTERLLEGENDEDAKRRAKIDAVRQARAALSHAQEVKP